MPHVPLFTAINDGCDKRCGYCTEYGESRDSTHGRLPLESLLRYTRLAYQAGYRTFRATGGEPTLRLDVGDYLSGVQDLGADTRVAITTNGTKLASLVPTLAKLTDPRVFVSIDAVDPGTVTGRFSIEKTLTPELDRTIREVSAVAVTRVNFVLTTGTRAQVRPLMEYCASVGVDLKVFELLHRDYFYAGSTPSLDVFAREFVPVRSLLDAIGSDLGKPERYPGTGGKGIPMLAYPYKGIKVVFFDSLGGSHYGDGCRSCSKYPCQEGLYAAVLTSTGLLHPAGCTNTTFHTRLEGLSDADVVGAFSTLAEVIDNASFSPIIPSYMQHWADDGASVAIRTR